MNENSHQHTNIPSFCFLSFNIFHYSEIVSQDFHYKYRLKNTGFFFVVLRIHFTLLIMFKYFHDD